MGGATPPYGKNIPPSLAQYWNHLIQNPPQSTGGQQFPAASITPPSMGQPYPGSFNPIWGLNAQTETLVPRYNPMSYYHDSTTTEYAWIFTLYADCLWSYWFANMTSSPKPPVPAGEMTVTFSRHFGSSKFVKDFK
jgi:hypothetical protein